MKPQSRESTLAQIDRFLAMPGSSPTHRVIKFLREELRKADARLALIQNQSVVISARQVAAQICSSRGLEGKVFTEACAEAYLRGRVHQNILAEQRTEGLS